MAWWIALLAVILALLPLLTLRNSSGAVSTDPESRVSLSAYAQEILYDFDKAVERDNFHQSGSFSYLYDYALRASQAGRLPGVSQALIATLANNPSQEQYEQTIRTIRASILRAAE